MFLEGPGHFLEVQGPYAEVAVKLSPTLLGGNHTAVGRVGFAEQPLASYTALCKVGCLADIAWR